MGSSARAAQRFSTASYRGQAAWRRPSIVAAGRQSAKMNPSLSPVREIRPFANRGGPMALALNIGKCTLLGNYRENNEDAIEVKTFPDMSVCIVADGMGGQAYGEIASKRA